MHQPVCAYRVDGGRESTGWLFFFAHAACVPLFVVFVLESFASFVSRRVACTEASAGIGNGNSGRKRWLINHVFYGAVEHTIDLTA